VIVVYGTVCQDRIHLLPRLPKPGGYVESMGVTLALGGEAANTALALLKLGADVTLAKIVLGDDIVGRWLNSELANAGLDEMTARDGASTPITDIFVTSDGERTMIGQGFSNLDGDYQPLPDLAGARWFTTDPNLLTSSRRAVKHAVESGISLYLMDFISPGDRDLVSACAVWQSSTDWAGTPDDPVHNAEWVSEHAENHGCPTVLTDGSRGIVIGRPGRRSTLLPVFPCAGVRDSTGAGDVFRAGTLAKLDSGWALIPSVMFGAAAASIAVGSVGASVELPTEAQVDAVIASNPAVADAYAAAHDA
jgi:sugar/nucleoside kinase (ribokinase family)